MPLRAQLQDAAGAAGAGADDVARAQPHVLRGALDHLWEGEVDGPSIVACELIAVDAPGHGEVVALVFAGAEAPVRQLVRRDEPGAERGGEILALGRPQV